MLAPDEYLHVHFLFLFGLDAIWDAAKKFFKLKTSVGGFLTEVVPQHLDRFLALKDKRSEIESPIDLIFFFVFFESLLFKNVLAA